ncbi:unnamed protein product, partial [Allacma fusca]
PKRISTLSLSVDQNGGVVFASSAKPEDNNNIQNPEEDPLAGTESTTVIDTSNGDARVEIALPGTHSNNGKFANDPWWVKSKGNRRLQFVLVGLILLVILVMILVITLKGPKSAKIITVTDTNELIGPTAGPYYRIDLSGFGGKLQGVSREIIAYLEALGVKSVIISQVLEFDDAS